jgi:hypothetical protein
MEAVEAYKLSLRHLIGKVNTMGVMLGKVVLGLFIYYSL